MTAISQQRYTLEEYLELEYQSERRHYFYKGIIAPMSYASENHELIVANLVGEIHALCKGTLYRVYPSNRMLYVPDCQLNYYPDVMVLKGEPQFQQYKKNMQATLNPYAIFEVLSDSTEAKDRFNKWHCYQTIPTLRQYFIISQTEPAIDIYNRMDDSDTWAYHAVTNLEASIRVGEFDIAVRDIYLLVQFPAKEATDESIQIAD